MTRHLWRFVLVGGSLLIGLWASAPTTAARELFWTAIVAGACLSVLAGIAVHRPRAAGPWWVLAGALGLLIISNVLLDHHLFGAAVGQLALVLELLAFPLFGVATLWMLRRQAPGGDRAGALDGLVVMIGLATVLDGVVLTADVVPQTEGLAQVLTLLAPLILAGMATAALRLVFIGGRPAPSTVVVVLAVNAGLAGHILRTLAQSDGTYARGGVEDAFIAAAYLCVGLAAAHPSMRVLAKPEPKVATQLTHARVGVLGLALLAAPLTHFLRSGLQGHERYLVGGGLVSLLVLGRMWQLVAERERARDDLRARATRDALTGLSNRTGLLVHLRSALARGTRSGSDTAVLFIDLDGFKRVNDAHGHQAGDAILVAVARHLEDMCRQGDLVARLAGDEFVLVAEQAGDLALSTLAERIIDSLAEISVSGTSDTPIAASVGIAIHHGDVTDGDQVDAEHVINHADAAMYEAKQGGGARWALFGEELGNRHRRRHDLELALRGALTDGGLELHHQPIVRLVGHEQRVVGYEAFLRWSPPGLGPVPPGELIAVAEASGLSGGVSAWVFAEACAELVRQRQFLDRADELAMFINVSPRELADRRLPSVVAETLRTSGAHPRDVVIEVTENAVIADLDAAVQTLRTFQSMGMRVALDDFGTGYSSLTHLKALPLDLVKIDASFVAGIGRPGSDRAIVEAVLGIAAHLGAEVVAEGVEEPWQLVALRELGCPLAQGYLLGQPGPAPTISAAVSA